MLLTYDVRLVIFFFQAEDGIRDLVRSRGLGDVYKRQRPIIAEIVTDSTFFYGGYATNGDSMLHWHYTGDENLLDGHAGVCTGYSGDSLFTFINSHGTHWGGHGYFTATWDMLIRRCTDAHVLMNDTSGTLELLPPEHSEQQASSGQVVHARLKPGQALPVGHTLVRLAGLGRSQRSAVVRSFELGNKNLLHTFHTVSYTHHRAHETVLDIVCSLLLEKKNFHLSVRLLRA